MQQVQVGAALSLGPGLNDNIALPAHNAEALALVLHLMRDLSSIDRASLHAVLAKRDDCIASVDDRLQSEQ